MKKRDNRQIESTKFPSLQVANNVIRYDTIQHNYQRIEIHIFKFKRPWPHVK